MTGRRIGLLGGTFDPVHYGHLQLAEAAIEECNLDKVVFVPSAQPPHKNRASITPFRHRLAMLTLAGAGIKGFECSAIEGLLPKPSYTIDTLRALKKQYENDCRLYFMIGADAFLDILTWKSPRQVLHEVNIIVSGRKGYDSAHLAELLLKLGYTEQGGHWAGEEGKRGIFILKKTPPDQSSSGIRAMIKKGQSVNRFLPSKVIDYIQAHMLY